MRKKVLAGMLMAIFLMLTACNNTETGQTADGKQTETAAASSKDSEKKEYKQADFSEEEIETAKTAVNDYLKTRKGKAEDLSYDKEVEKTQKPGFMEFGMGKGLDSENVMILTGKGNYKLNGIAKEAHVFYLGRKDSDSAWEVKDMSF